MSVDVYVAVHVLLQAILPYILPFLIMMVPLCYLINVHNKGIGEKFHQEIVRNVIILATSYTMVHLPMAITTIVIFPIILR